MQQKPFYFKKFSIFQEKAAHPVGTDGVLLGAWADVHLAKTILDIGTGTGVIALMLAQRATENAPCIVALEPNEESFECAVKNFKGSSWHTLIHAAPLTVQQYSAVCPEKFDLIVSNPPYFKEGLQPADIGRKMARHTNTLSPEDLLQSVQQLLAPTGRFCVILPPIEARALCERAALLGLYYTKITAVKSRQDAPTERLLVQFENNPVPFVKDTLIIYADHQHYTPAYKALTRDFYLNF
jgi:tRNA1Val (adenine37-N6)-methyltransferase